jgi:hypothetical protein
MIADDLSRISMSAGLATTVSRAVDCARTQGHQDVTLEHMLLALCDDPDAALVLASSNIDATRLRADVAGYLSGIERRATPYGQSADPVVSADLLRILEAAAAAARGGRRREINGAIVLAAIVGDGKSHAASLLRIQGLTFEGAIRALQTARHALTAPPTAGDILAGARERVQARARGPVYPERKAQAEPVPVPPQAEPAPQPEHEAEPEVEEVYAELGEPAVEAQPAAPGPADAGSEWDIGSAPQQEPAPEPEPIEAETTREDAARQMPESAPFPPPLPLPEAPAGRTPPPFADRGAPASLPRSVPPPMPPVPSAPASRSGVAWPDALPKPSGGTFRPRVEGIGSAAEDRYTRLERARGITRSLPPLGTGRTPLAQGARPAGARVRAEVGQLAENIPRTMRVAVPVLVEVRIARSDVRNLAEGMQGGGDVQQHEIKITKVMSVSLRAPDGGFFIESASPETRFFDGTHSLSTDDFASWRWHVTPREKGRKRLQLVFSARTIADGLVAETALPDQVITVRVRTNYGKSFVRGVGWIVAAVAGGLIARFGEGAFDAGWRIFSGFIHR